MAFPRDMISIEVTGKAYEALKEIAASRGLTIGEVLSEAIALERWLDETTRQGGTVLVQNKDKVRELIAR